MAHIKTDFSYQVKKLENTWIEMSDGIRLAATVWLPENADQKPVPAILEYLPYRKDDSRAVRDSSYLPYFAGHGYACIRVDIRGTGASDGILYDEYLPQEQDDALEIIDWIAEQTWCSGKVGIIGISWGGFNGLQIAARRPPQLKAIISVASTDDRYADDVHYMGGCVLGSDMLSWASRMFQLNALPPDPELVGSRWREMWFDRLENTPPYVHTWLRHQTRDDFWKHGSVCEDYSSIEAAVYAIGGWADAYTNAIPRLLEGLPGPKKGLIGPWSHEYPYAGVPGPQIGFLQECLRWWDFWLKGEQTGIMDEPIFRFWIQDSISPAPMYQEWPGYWGAENSWPSPRIVENSYYLLENGLAIETRPNKRLSSQGTLFHRAQSGAWCPYGDPVDLPPDQGREDGLCLIFDSPPVEEPVEILGNPLLELFVSSDQPLALAAVRLCDLSPTGESLQVSKGLLNLTHRHSHENPEPLQPGKFYQVRINLDAAGHRLAAGHRWRLAVSSAYWPMAWPSPRTALLKIRVGDASRLILPVRPPRSEDRDLPRFSEPEINQPRPHQIIRSSSRSRKIQEDIANRTLEIRDHNDHGHTKLLDTGLEVYSENEDRYRIQEDQPLSAEAVSTGTMGLKREDWDIRVETTSRMTSDSDQFLITNILDAYEGEVRVFSKTWHLPIDRHLV